MNDHGREPPCTQHASFSIDRRLSAPPAKVYAAFANAAAKGKWFARSDGLKLIRNDFDFRVGGEERVDGRWQSGVVSSFRASYRDIVPERRIVYAYDLFLDERKISVSLATIEFLPDGAGTRLKLTEQGAFLDGYDDAGSRERGTNELMDAMARSLAD